jgi:FkbM family methyltransferase
MNFKSLAIRLYNFGYNRLSGSGLYKIHFIRRINKKILSLIRQRSVVVNGLTLYLDKKDSLNLTLNKNYEPAETAFLKATIKKGQYVIDVGANIGYYTTLLASLVGEEGRVYAFEPDPENFALLKKNISANGFKNVVAENMAISDVTKDILLYYSSDKGDQRIYDSSDGRESRKIKATSIDDYFKNGQKIDFLKMDIQGAEGLALKGMTETIQRSKSIVLNIEFWPFGLERSGFGTMNFLNDLVTTKLRFYDLNNKELSEVNRERFPEVYKSETKAFTNLICSHAN